MPASFRFPVVDTQLWLVALGVVALLASYVPAGLDPLVALRHE